MKKLWSIPIITVYLYAVTILTQWGYYSFFSIPSDFVEASIKDNIVYFFTLFKVAEEVAGVLKWYVWAMLIFTILIVGFVYTFNYTYKRLITALGTLILIFFLINSYNFGNALAKNSILFLVPDVGCSGISNGPYIIPGISNNQVILVPIDKNNKMLGGFIVKNIPDLGCKLEYKSIGLIKQ